MSSRARIFRAAVKGRVAAMTDKERMMLRNGLSNIEQDEEFEFMKSKPEAEVITETEGKSY